MYRLPISGAPGAVDTTPAAVNAEDPRLRVGSVIRAALVARPDRHDAPGRRGIRRPVRCDESREPLDGSASEDVREL